MIVDDVMTDKITLHGLGFVQVQLPANQRLHVWHPELPRRHCFEHSAIHNHRFDFTSYVLVGQQINIDFADLRPGAVGCDEPTHVMYLHEGPRTPRGGRPWVPDCQAKMLEMSRQTIETGWVYRMRAYDFHRTEAGGDGKVATIMTKTWEGQKGAHSSCLIGIDPDVDFDRYQWSPSHLWEIVSDVLTGSKQP